MKRYRNTRLSTDARLRRSEVVDVVEETDADLDTNVEVIMDQQPVEENVNSFTEE
jgi:hypothetical protein